MFIDRKVNGALIQDLALRIGGGGGWGVTTGGGAAERGKDGKRTAEEGKD